MVRVLALTTSFSQELTHFGTVTLTPAHVLDGEGTNVDSIAFWETPDPADTLMFVTGKSNDLVEVWHFPFEDNELEPIEFPDNVNGVVVDQETDTLYVSDRIISVISLPELEVVDEFGHDIIGVGENNLDILKHADGPTLIYVSDDRNVHRFDAATFEFLGTFAPPVSSIETILADDFHQVIYVPEEQGPEGNPGVFAYHPDSTPFKRNGSNRFGNDGEFSSDEEGIALYTFPASGIGDNGQGFIVISDQRRDVNEYEFFDRVTWAHLGTLRLEDISNTDGIASTQRSLPNYPLGLFAAIDDDTATAIIGWDAIFEAIGWNVAPVESPYQLWASERGLAGGINDGFDDDPDHDGRSNLEEFALDGNPLSGIDEGKQRVLIDEIDRAHYLTYTFAMRNDAKEHGLTYSLSASQDLVEFAQSGFELSSATSEGLPTLNAGWSYRTFGLSNPIGGQPAGFAILTVAAARP